MPPHTPHTFLYNTIIVKYKQVYSHVNSPHIFTAADMLLAHIRTVVLFYLHRRHGWFTPASVYSQSALRCSLLISGHSSKRKPVVHTSVTTGFFFPHCLRLHHAHSSAGTGWHCWSVLFDCSYC